MNELQATASTIPAMSSAAIENVRRLECAVLQSTQVEVKTLHVIHGGMYSRTIKMPQNALMTGALIKIPTTLIINGHVTVYLDGEARDFVGYNVLPASAGRKQAFFAHQETDLTMIFPTNAKTVKEAEAEFTDEIDLLVSRMDDDSNFIIITGE